MAAQFDRTAVRRRYYTGNWDVDHQWTGASHWSFYLERLLDPDFGRLEGLGEGSAAVCGTQGLMFDVVGDLLGVRSATDGDTTDHEVQT